MSTEISLTQHHTPKGFSDYFALAITKTARFFANTFFARRYGNRAIVLETVAAVPGMVGGVLQHLRALRRMESDRGWIHILLDVFFNGFFLLYLLSPGTAHRVVGYFEEEAVHSYTEYLNDVDSGKLANVPAPKIAIDYWKLASDSRLRDVIIAVREDESHHRDVNHRFADELA
jgi:ubiquinol oxidase